MSNQLWINSCCGGGVKYFMVMPKVKNTENTDKFRRVCQRSRRTYCKFIGLPKQSLFNRVVNPHRDRSMSLLLLTLIIEHQLGLVERWVLPDNSCITIHVDIFVYYMAIVVCALWLADSCNNRELLARCPRHIQSVLVIVGILMDDHVMVKRQLSKRASTGQCHLPIL